MMPAAARRCATAGRGQLAAWYDEQVAQGRLVRERAHDAAVAELDRLLHQLSDYAGPTPPPPPMINYPCPTTLARLRQQHSSLSQRLTSSLKYWFSTVLQRKASRPLPPQLHNFGARPLSPTDPRPPLHAVWRGRPRSGGRQHAAATTTPIDDPFPVGRHQFGPPSPAPQSVGLIGSVGVGKSLLMDAFFALAPLPAERKRRVHFHDFLADYHGVWMGRWRDGQTAWAHDPIGGVARGMAAETTLLCLDEVHVTDKVNALIVSRLLADLWYHGVVTVTTSNKDVDQHWESSDPHERRAILQPLVAAWRQHVNTVRVAGDALPDYRRTRPLNTDAYVLLPADGTARQACNGRLLHRLSGGGRLPCTVQRLHCSPTRSVQLTSVGSDGVAVADFRDLCSRPLGSAEYAAIASRYHTLCLLNVPAFRHDTVSEARRFIILVDQLYERRVALLVSADAAPDDLFAFAAAGDRQASATVLEEAFDDRSSVSFAGAFNLKQSVGLTGLSDTAFMYHRAVSRLFELTSLVDERQLQHHSID